MISFIVPVRNEKENIVECIKSIKNSVEKDYEIIVVDDNSDDGTYEILKKLEDIKLIKIEEKPENIVGKNYALYRGYLESKGDILVFLDADVRITKEGLSQALALLEEYDAISFSPKQITGSFFEFCIQPIVFYFLESLYPYSHSIAMNGQFIAIKKKVYEDIGTHKVIAHELLEDMMLAKLLDKNGYRIYFDKTDKIYTRMYRNLKEIFYGWSKNLYLLANKRIYLLFKPTLKILSLILFWYFIVILSFAKEKFLLSLIFFFLSNLEFYLKFRSFGFYNLLSATIGIILFIAISINSIYWYKIRKEIFWKNRIYKILE
ncbi:MAG: glycosyltransferase family 2 protein [candidate division WOR-3 bacterium]|nr:glycosyltransferase family 2 protein [candidate division WOR-3 bacterium]MCX7948026.1 glycosyltransferase family 2 protein [candidate division WOR-3 bacterium]MDW8151076.1 glycosyltransferase family 2 protein [candidate division WOR-3 bacterium]